MYVLYAQGPMPQYPSSWSGYFGQPFRRLHADSSGEFPSRAPYIYGLGHENLRPSPYPSVFGGPGRPPILSVLHRLLDYFRPRESGIGGGGGVSGGGGGGGGGVIGVIGGGGVSGGGGGGVSGGGGGGVSGVVSGGGGGVSGGGVSGGGGGGVVGGLDAPIRTI